jgi:lysophospholipase L1-like esterase
MEGKTETVVAVNAQLRQLAASRNIHFIELFPSFTIPGTHTMRLELTIDGLHLTSAGYKIWSEILRRELKI